MIDLISPTRKVIKGLKIKMPLKINFQEWHNLEREAIYLSDNVSCMWSPHKESTFIWEVSVKCVCTYTEEFGNMLNALYNLSNRTILRSYFSIRGKILVNIKYSCHGEVGVIKEKSLKIQFRIRVKK